MGKSIVFGAVMCAILLVAATTRSDVATNSTSTTSSSTPEPISGMPAQNAPGWEHSARDPFKPYEITPAPDDDSPKPHWHYDDLTPADKAVADLGRDTSRWAQVHDAFAGATAERSRQAAADSAARQLGIENVTAGVVP